MAHLGPILKFWVEESVQARIKKHAARCIWVGYNLTSTPKNPDRNILGPTSLLPKTLSEPKRLKDDNSLFLPVIQRLYSFLSFSLA